ncbi:hypothetical protein [Streptomyces afghaniensis]|uniref:hypothetical protein n=1 Tax=Streptomyces afghaniensis TaxID=66865 RepID=UPI0027850F96|nr:hypothetical protein [Streptomyces afghaniensis]MDQ1015176.1 phosphopantetheine adenylyltransferase [Streptomyces afghaniensis]
MRDVDLSNVTVDSHTGGLLVDHCRRLGIDVVIRGVRGVRDLDYEMPMARMNRELAGVKTFFIAADPTLAHISSTLVTGMSRQDRVPNDALSELLPAHHPPAPSEPLRCLDALAGDADTDSFAA